MHYLIQPKDEGKDIYTWEGGREGGKDIYRCRQRVFDAIRLVLVFLLIVTFSNSIPADRDERT